MDASAAGLTGPATLVIIGALLNGLSGVPGLFLRRSANLGQKTASAIMAAGSILGLAGTLATLIPEKTYVFTISGNLPFGPSAIGLDPLSAFFLIPIFILTACCALYGNGYWPAAIHPRSTPKLSFFFGLLAASLAFLIMARDGVLFLIFWEIMALSCFFALATDDREKEVRDAAYIYLVATHAGTLALFATFSMLRHAASAFLFPPPGTLDGTSPLATAIFCTALFGFGLKAGIMPLHFWLPVAHASAPSHVSAVMSGVLIKVGIYGMVRVFSFYTHIPLWWGVVILIAGAVSGVLGVAFAVGQHDLKRLLAYHSIENIGIITIGIGIALIGQATGKPALVMLGMGGALLHMLNHATFKSLLFLGAGSVIHATGTREIDLMGGLARRMPWSAPLFLTGAVAICGLPPLNGFVSEYLIYLGLFSGVRDGSGTAVSFLALATPALAIIGGLALLCFVKVYGAVFLGMPRSPLAEKAHEAGLSMLFPMSLLATLCAFIGLFPATVARLIEPALYAWSPNLALAGMKLSETAPLGWITALGLTLLLVVLILGLLLAGRLKSAPRTTFVTWDCGYAAPTARMQYTASSFAEMLVKLFAGVLRPHAERPEVKEIFPQKWHFASHVPEVVLELVIIPACTAIDRRLSVLRRLQHGQLHLYILYIFVTLAILLAWAY